jgi:hypothetical protein
MMTIAANASVASKKRLKNPQKQLPCFGINHHNISLARTMVYRLDVIGSQGVLFYDLQRLLI